MFHLPIHFIESTTARSSDNAFYFLIYFNLFVISSCLPVNFNRSRKPFFLKTFLRVAFIFSPLLSNTYKFIFKNTCISHIHDVYLHRDCNSAPT